MRKIILFCGAILLVGCGAGGDEPCIAGDAACDVPGDAVTSGLGGEELPENVCRELIGLDCSSGTCVDVYQTDCDTSRAHASGELGELSQAVVIPGCLTYGRLLGVEAFRKPGIPPTGPWRDAATEFNALFDDGLEPRMAVTNNVRRTDNNRNDISSMRIEERSEDNDDFAGVAECLRDEDNNRRFRCALRIFSERIEEYAADIGADAQQMARNTALHEIGHAACLDHYFIDPSVPTPIDRLSAMNSFHLVDDERGQLDYFRYTDDDKEELRAAVAFPGINDPD